MVSRGAPVAITLAACSKTFADGTRALEPIDIVIAPGETVLLLGPSGCGKTTMLRLIAGLEKPDAGGTVLFDGADVTSLPIEKRNVGMVFQSYALFPNMSVAENIGYGLRIRRKARSEIARRVEEMLSLVRIQKLADRRIDQLSGGQRQRVALARALAVEPLALLLDEPLTALDAKLREELRLEIDGLLRSLRITTVYVTHDQAEAMALADRVVVMSEGRVAQSGAPREIYERPSTAFVAEFIGTMNVLQGTLRAGAFVTNAGAIPWPDAPSQANAVRFRPEDVRIDDVSPQLRGTIVSVVYLGDRTRLIVDAGAARPVVLETSERRGFSRGSPVGLSIDARGFLVLPEAT